MKKFWLLGLLILGLLSCKNTPTTPTTPKPPDQPLLYATIVAFDFSPSECWYLEEGKTTLRWEVTDSTSVTIDNGVGQVDAKGTLVLGPFSANKSYVITAYRDQTKVTQTATYTVKPRAVWHMSSYEWYSYPSGAWGIRGYITNIGNRTANNTQITWTAYDDHKNIIETAVSFIGVVAPKGNGNYDCYFPHGYPSSSDWRVTNDY